MPMQGAQASLAAKKRPAATKKKVMGMRSTQPRMQGPISGGAGGGFSQMPGPGTSGAPPSWMPPPPGSPGAPQLNLQPFVGGPSQGRPAMPNRGPMPLPPSAAQRPGMPPMTPPMRPGQPPAGGMGMPPPMMGGGDQIDRFGGGFNPQQMQVQRAAGVFDKPQMPGAGGMDQRAQMMAKMQAQMGQMGQMQKPPGMMGSVAPQPGPGGGMGPGGFDRNAMMQQLQGGMAQANQQRDAWRQANPNPVMNQMPAGRGGGDVGGQAQYLQQMMAARGGGQPQF